MNGPNIIETLISIFNYPIEGYDVVLESVKYAVKLTKYQSNSIEAIPQQPDSI